MPFPRAIAGPQLDLPIEREHYPDRHWDKGGRSFYFFDFDDNVMRLATPIFVFDRDSGAELALSTAELIAAQPQLGEPGPWERYEIRTGGPTGSYRRFRDREEPDAEQPFVEDLNAALALPPSEWKGPSWELFFHAVHNQRPLAIITARGHHPTTMARGVGRLRQEGHLTSLPSFLAILPVSHPAVRAQLGDPDRERSIPELKQEAIFHCIEAAMARYGENPFHRFGMSDDAPDNLELISEAMRRLKNRYPRNAFFVIDASRTPVVKTEILDGDTSVDIEEVADLAQLDLFARR